MNIYEVVQKLVLADVMNTTDGIYQVKIEK